MPKRLKTLLGLAFLVAVAVLLVHLARQQDWAEVGRSLQELPAHTLLGAAGLAATSHLLYSSFDLFGRHLIGHRLSTLSVMRVTFTSYVFNLNLGFVVGGVGFRFRLYHQLGLGATEVSQVTVTSMLTNWLGHLALAAVLLWSLPLALPTDWPIAQWPLRPFALGLAALVGLYLLSTVLAGGRQLRWRRFAMRWPDGRMAALQLLASSANWCLMAGIVYLLLPTGASYPQVLATLLLAAVAGVLAHIPAGLGVVEAVFVAMLGPSLGEAPVLAAVLAYRALYYLAPLLPATVLYLRAEAHTHPAANASTIAG